MLCFFQIKLYKTLITKWFYHWCYFWSKINFWSNHQSRELQPNGKVSPIHWPSIAHATSCSWFTLHHISTLVGLVCTSVGHILDPGLESTQFLISYQPKNWLSITYDVTQVGLESLNIKFEIPNSLRIEVLFIIIFNTQVGYNWVGYKKNHRYSF
jgi:hypothetical protein